MTDPPQNLEKSLEITRNHYMNHELKILTNKVNFAKVDHEVMKVMKVTGLNGKANSAKVHFYAINDFGGAIEGNARL